MWLANTDAVSTAASMRPPQQLLVVQFRLRAFKLGAFAVIFDPGVDAELFAFYADDRSH
jgi:hypothetical protein